MTVKLKEISLLTLLIGLFSCSNSNESPEKVVEQFSTYLSSGECRKAADLCIDTAKETVQGSIDSGCETYDSKIDSVLCIRRENKAQCLCYEKRMGMEFNFPYELELVDEKWKISYLAKDGGQWFSEADSADLE